MKHLIAILSVVLMAVPAAAYQVCGPRVDGTEISYSPVALAAIDGIYLGTWAVGSGCNGETELVEVEQMCTSVVAGGHAFCGLNYWAYEVNDMDESSADVGSGCWCRRTKMMAGDTLVDSVGQWVLIADVNYSMAQCREQCPQMCAESVAYNDNDMRTAIMVLSSF